MRRSKGAVKLTALLHEPCAPDLAGIHTGGDSAALSQPEESMWPVNQMMLSRKLPNSGNQPRKDQAYAQQIWKCDGPSLMGPIENHA